MLKEIKNKRNPLLSKSEWISEEFIFLIKKGLLLSGSSLPSISAASQKFKVARKTVVKAYNKLKLKGYVESRPRLGYFVISTIPNSKMKLLLLIHSFDPQLKMLYAEFVKILDAHYDVELYFHHYNIQLFEMIISQNIDRYDVFVLSSFDHKKIRSIVAQIPKEKVFVISRNDQLANCYSSVVQDFYNGIFNALKAGVHLIRKYNSMHLCCSEAKGHSKTLSMGFEKFCNEYKIDFSVVDSLADQEIKKGCVYLVLDDLDLVRLLKVSKNRGWEIGSDIGIISFNENPLKEVIRDGITVISCSFIEMAAEMARKIRDRVYTNTITPIELIERNSL